MIPSTTHIMEKRHACRRRLRYTALCLVITSCIFLSYWVLECLLSGEWWWSDNAIAFSLAFTVPAIPMWLLDRRLARLIVPMPRALCPGCGYRLEALTAPRCPECGVAIPRVFVSGAGGAQSSGPGAGAA